MKNAGVHGCVHVLRLTLDLLVLSGHHQEMIRILNVGIGIVQVQPVHVEQVVACDALGCELALTVSELRLWYHKGKGRTQKPNNNKRSRARSHAET